MHVTELGHVLDELRTFVGRHRGQVWQPRRDQLVIELGGERLVIVTGSGRARMHLSRHRPKQPPRPFSFQGACRARLGGMLTDVRLLGTNRACELEFGPTTLHFRLFGRGLGLLVGADGTPIAAMDGPAPAQVPPLGDPPGPPRPPRFEPEEGETWNQAADRFFGERARTILRKDLLARVRRGLTREVKRLDRLVKALESDLDATARAPALRERADTLATHLHQVRRGERVVHLPSLDDPDTPMEIPLDPRLTPAENLNRLYNKARRLDRAGDRVLERLDTQERLLADHRRTLETLDELDLHALRDLERTLPKPRPQSSHPARRGWDTWHGPGGMRLRIGRNEKANRALCFSASRGRDWWLHLRNRPGAHVVLTLGRQQSPPLEALLAGAELVLMAARIPEGSAADVQYTQIRHLRPVPGDSGAKVRIAEEKVLRVTRDPGQLDAWTREDL